MKEIVFTSFVKKVYFSWQINKMLISSLLYLKYVKYSYDSYTPIAFDDRVFFWLQRAGSLPCECGFAALYACAIA